MTVDTRMLALLHCVPSTIIRNKNVSQHDTSKLAYDISGLILLDNKENKKVLNFPLLH